ncbi:NUDIX hydrolase [Reinekea marina]|uniref:NUDIX hydrolase n=1 Tax=Reinekea marina TaxID=1310421 RepID=A0ABV7WWJ0_9GAMM|nr:NUDIX hydrolase [Reinekea marina]MDN3649762.1 NUDIX hydrolase [Reinekea marina]
MESQETVLQHLSKVTPSCEEEAKSLEFITQFVAEQPRYWARDTLVGHLTASAWITNAEQTKAVLLHHKKLDIWVQPGGHVDDSDESLAQASLREAQEETGLANLTLKQTEIFDVDVHAIPERKSEPKHNHLDIRYWFIADNETLTISEESNELKWMSRAEIEMITQEESVLRMVRKTLL